MESNVADSEPMVDIAAVAEPELQDYLRQLEVIRRDAAALVAGLGAGQMKWRPEPGRWSIVECFDHLNSVSAMYIPLFAERIADARAKGMLAAGPFRYSFLGNKFVGSLEPPVKMKVKMPKGMEAPVLADPATVLPEFDRLTVEMAKVMASADGVDLRGVKISSAFSKVLRLSLGQWFAFVNAHTRRHLWQARNIMERPDFPKS